MKIELQKSYRTLEGWPTSCDPTIRKLNRLIYRAFPPTKRHDTWLYGRLYFSTDYAWKNRPPSDPEWVLDGMTPVGSACVLQILQNEGHDTGAFVKHFQRREAAMKRWQARREKLRASARLKLTPAERAVCFLTA